MLLVLLQCGFTAVPGLNPDNSLDRSKISRAYFEGDFDLVEGALEAFRKAQPNPSKDDRIYMYKYLSVINAARPETKAKAESYMYQLLKLVPTMELMDLYISDNVESIFTTVRARFEQQQRIGLDSGQGEISAQKAKASSPPAAPAASLSAQKPAPVSPPAKQAKLETRGSTAWIWWTAGALSVAAVSGYVYLAEAKPKSAPPTKTIDF
jgi:hypothetical protein